MASEARGIVRSVLGDHMTAKVWTGLYTPVFPFNLENFSVGAVLPMLLYLFRWGHRRGRGKFQTAFGAIGGKPAIRGVAEKLASDERFSGFDTEFGRTVLGDLLLTSALENRRRAEGHEEQIQRCFASHYMASWIDLPRDAGAVRGVPELIAALIADQRRGGCLEPGLVAGRYPVGARIEQNEFLTAFAQGMRVEGDYSNDIRSDRFDETAAVGLDQLLVIRLAQLCGEAPGKAHGKGEPGPIPNQHPIASRAAKQFRDDFIVFFDCYGRDGAIPRLAFLPMLESAVAVGLTTIALATVDIIGRWSSLGRIAEDAEQAPWPVFVDCSGSADPAIRQLAEQSSELLRRQFAGVSTALMYMRLLDFFVRTEANIASKELPETTPFGTAWLDLLGSIAKGSHEESGSAEKFFRGRCRALADAAEEAGSSEPRSDILRAEGDGRKYGEKLAEALALASEGAIGTERLGSFIGSSLMTDEPNGLARRRRIVLSRPGPSGRRTTDATSFVLTNTALEYLVHRQLRKDGKGRKPRDLSLPDFITLVRERYGFFVDQSPPNMEVPNDILQRNRRMLERRLRDLGLLIGVNDAERMKKLRPRYRTSYDTPDAGAASV